MVRLQVLNDAASVVHPLETFMMRHHMMSYAKAADIVANARSRLGMSRSDQWTEALKLECQKMLESSAGKDIMKAPNNNEKQESSGEEPTDATEESTDGETTERGSIEETGISHAECLDVKEDSDSLSAGFAKDGKKGEGVERGGAKKNLALGGKKCAMVRTQLLSNPIGLSAHSLETTIMRRHEITYAKACDLISKAREKLCLPKSVLWSEELVSECDSIIKAERDPTPPPEFLRIALRPVKKDSEPAEDRAACVSKKNEFADVKICAGHSCSVALSLESLMMSQYGINYSAASSLVAKARATLEISRWDKWTEQLKHLCERLIETETNGIRAVGKPSGKSTDAVKSMTREIHVGDEVTSDVSSNVQTRYDKLHVVSKSGCSACMSTKSPTKAKSAADLYTKTKDHVPTDSTELLEQILMRRRGICFAEASSVVRAGRLALGIPEWQHWNSLLMKECESLVENTAAKLGTRGAHNEMIKIITSPDLRRIIPTSTSGAEERFIVSVSPMQILADASAASRPLETILMQRHRLNWCEASDIVNKVRIALGMRKWEPWTSELEEMCEQLLASESEAEVASGSSDAISVESETFNAVLVTAETKKELGEVKAEHATCDCSQTPQSPSHIRHIVVLVSKEIQHHSRGQQQDEMVATPLATCSLTSAGEMASNVTDSPKTMDDIITDAVADDRALLNAAPKTELRKNWAEQAVDDCSQVSRCPPLGQHIALIVQDEEKGFSNEQQKEVDTDAATAPRDNFSIPAMIYIHPMSTPEVPDDEPLEMPLGLPVHRQFIPKQRRSLLSKLHNSIWGSKATGKDELSDHGLTSI